MHNPFLMHPLQLKKIWRELRREISRAADEQDACLMARDFWSQVPLVTKFLNLDRIETWPSPWDLIADNRFDIDSANLGLYYTLVMDDAPVTRGKILLISLKLPNGIKRLSCMMDTGDIVSAWPFSSKELNDIEVLAWYNYDLNTKRLFKLQRDGNNIQDTDAAAGSVTKMQGITV